MIDFLVLVAVRNHLSLLVCSSGGLGTRSQREAINSLSCGRPHFTAFEKDLRSSQTLGQLRKTVFNMPTGLHPFHQTYERPLLTISGLGDVGNECRIFFAGHYLHPAAMVREISECSRF